jgi:nucleoside-diphosphate-sugar epimerase
MDASAEPRAGSLSNGHRLIVTGATGTLGRSVLDEIIAQKGTQALALLRNKSRLTKIHSSVRYEEVDFLDSGRLAELVQGLQPTAFIHCAASGMQTPRPGWSEMVRFNVDVSVQLCELVSRIPGCQFVYISTGLAYADQGRPLREEDPLDTRHPYAASKAAAEMLVRAVAAEFDVPLTVVRPFSFSGPGDAGTRLFPSLLRAAEQKTPFDLSPGDQVRDHCAVTDIAGGIVRAVIGHGQLVVEPQVFNLGSGNTIPLRKLVSSVVEELELEVTLNFGARAPAQYEPRFVAADISRARTLLQWQPQMNFAYAIWQLARESFPNLKLRQPRRQL